MGKKRKKKQEPDAPADAYRFYGGSGASFGGSVATDIYMKRIKHRLNGMKRMMGTPKAGPVKTGHLLPDGSVEWD
jgi:hypothetical protein